ncbi:MAG: hypothetical protein L6428_09765 [Candidatus Aminicenantes bacterium]|nr:hypothetical protein [Candidatus Aminicenantes bacterium]
MLPGQLHEVLEAQGGGDGHEAGDLAEQVLHREVRRREKPRENRQRGQGDGLRRGRPR